MRLRLAHELQRDPNLWLMVGRMVGAVEIASMQMQSRDTSPEKLAEMGRRMEALAAWFLAEKPSAMPEIEQRRDRA